MMVRCFDGRHIDICFFHQALRDHAPTVDLATVEQVIFEDFGKSVHTLFQVAQRKIGSF